MTSGAVARPTEREPELREQTVVVIGGLLPDLEAPIDHVMVTAGGPCYAPLTEMDFDEARRALAERPMRSKRGADELRVTLWIGRVVGPADVAALAVHTMTNTALTGATYDIDGDQQLLPD